MARAYPDPACLVCCDLDPPLFLECAQVFGDAKGACQSEGGGDLCHSRCHPFMRDMHLEEVKNGLLTIGERVGRHGVYLYTSQVAGAKRI